MPLSAAQSVAEIALQKASPSSGSTNMSASTFAGNSLDDRLNYAGGIAAEGGLSQMRTLTASSPNEGIIPGGSLVLVDGSPPTRQSAIASSTEFGSRLGLLSPRALTESESQRVGELALGILIQHRPDTDKWRSEKDRLCHSNDPIERLAAIQLIRVEADRSHIFHQREIVGLLADRDPRVREAATDVLANFRGIVSENISFSLLGRANIDPRLYQLAKYSISEMERTHTGYDMTFPPPGGWPSTYPNTISGWTSRIIEGTGEYLANDLLRPTLQAVGGALAWLYHKARGDFTTAKVEEPSSQARSEAVASATNVLKTTEKGAAPVAKA